jgi:hypothetical protein
MLGVWVPKVLILVVGTEAVRDITLQVLLLTDHGAEAGHRILESAEQHLQIELLSQEEEEGEVVDLHRYVAGLLIATMELQDAIRLALGEVVAHKLREEMAVLLGQEPLPVDRPEH